MLQPSRPDFFRLPSARPPALGTVRRPAHGALYPFGLAGQPNGKRILLVTETHQQINGVSTTVDGLIRTLKQKGFTVDVLHPELFPTLPTNYPDMRVPNPIGLKKRIHQKIEASRPDRILILTEGPLGWAARNYCQNRKIPFSTSYSVKWDDYLKTHFHVPKWLTMRFLKKFHEKAQAVLVITPSLMDDLKRAGFKNLVLWKQAVDVDRFHPLPEAKREVFRLKAGLGNRPRPFYLYVGRVSAEKNIEAFLKADLPGTKIIIGPEGAGMSLDRLRETYPDAVFTGPQKGQELADFYASSDVFVFPSKADTLGLVMLEALASGLPVVGFDVTGPKDVIPRDGAGNGSGNGKVGFLARNDKELRMQAIRAWKELQTGQISRKSCRDLAMTFSWPQCAQTMLNNLKIHLWPNPPKPSDNHSGEPQESEVD